MISPTSSPEIAPQGDASTRAPLRMSFEEFLVREDGNTRVEWVNGEVISMSPVTAWHQNLLDFLTAILRHHVEENDLGAVRSAGYIMRMPQRTSGREPDILFVAQENISRLRETFLDGPADLVVEIISPESRARDRGDKFYEYEAGGVREYWLIDPQRRQAEWYQLGDDGIYRAAVVSDGIYHSRVLAGLWLREEWLWQPPKLRDVLKAWNLL